MVIKKIFLVLLLILMTSEESQTGLKISINESFTKVLSQALVPRLAKILNHIDIPDISFKESGITGTVSDFTVDIPIFTQDQIDIQFIEPNLIQVNIYNVQGKAHAKVKAKYLILSCTKKIDLEVKKLDFSPLIRIDQSSGENLLIYDSITFDFDFDYDISGVASFIEKWLKGPFKKLITKQGEKAIRKIADKFLAELNEKIPPYITIDEKSGYSVSLDIIEKPKITNEYLIFNFYGKLINKYYEETLNPPFDLPTDIKEFDPNGKQFQIILSDYVFKTALNTYYITDGFNWRFTPETLPSGLGDIKLNSDFFTKIFAGFDKKYGSNTDCEVDFSLTELPTLKFNGQSAQIIAPSKIIIYVRIDNAPNNLEKAVEIETDIVVQASINIDSENVVTVKANKLSMANTEIPYTVFPDTTAYMLENAFNFLVQLIIPKVNDFLKTSFYFKLPSFIGLDFEDVTIDFNSNYVIIQYNMEYSEQLLVNYFINNNQ